MSSGIVLVFVIAAFSAACQMSEKKVDGETKSVEVAPANVNVGSDTAAAIQRFERERKIPVTGQMSDRLVKELTAMIGHPID